MATIEERVSYVEGRIEEQATAMLNIRDDIRELGQRMEQRFIGVDQRFIGIDQRLLSLEDKMSKQFYWLVGIQMTTFAATIAILTAFLAR